MKDWAQSLKELDKQEQQEKDWQELKPFIAGAIVVLAIAVWYSNVVVLIGGN